MIKRRNQIISIAGSALLICLFAGTALAASDVPWPRETEDTHFYGFPEANNTMTEVVATTNAGEFNAPDTFKTQSSRQVTGTTYVTPNDFPWPREHEDPHFYNNVQ